jgi:CRP-like cAMP-binding protein
MGATLFKQGSAVTGVHVIESGAVRILLSTGENQTQQLGVIGPGTMLGLGEAMNGGTHRISAEASNQTTAAFIPREKLVQFLSEHADFCMEVAKLLSEDLHALYHKFRSISAHPGRPRQRPLDEQLN